MHKRSICDCDQKCICEVLHLTPESTYEVFPAQRRLSDLWSFQVACHTKPLSLLGEAHTILCRINHCRILKLDSNRNYFTSKAVLRYFLLPY